MLSTECSIYYTVLLSARSLTHCKSENLIFYRPLIVLVEVSLDVIWKNRAWNHYCEIVIWTKMSWNHGRETTCKTLLIWNWRHLAKFFVLWREGHSILSSKTLHCWLIHSVLTVITWTKKISSFKTIKYTDA